MSIGRILLVMLALVTILAIPAVALGQATTTTITGSVTYNDSYVPLADDVLLVQLRDNNRITLVEAQPRPVIGKKSPPYNYTISIASSRITSGGTYQIVAQLGHANQDRVFLGSTPITISGNTASASTITMVRTGGRLNDTGSGALALLAGLALAVLAGALVGWRWLRARAPARQLA